MRKGVNKVALRLFEHNEKAYRAVVRMMEQYGKAAIVHPTGTGKSYIAFKLIEDNPEKVVIWLSPSEYIFKTQLESLKKNDPGFPLSNVHFYTYAKLMCCTQAQLEKIAAQKPAYIILDEFHRAGAECWGESTVALLKLCPEAKLLGLTATNIRYLDNNRDMAEELFDGHMMQNDFGLISIIMAAYNAEKTIKQAINSVLSQTYTNFELLVVNDCSKDRTVELVKDIVAKDSRVRLISNVKNSGVSYTRKHGLEEAKGDWIAILDSDDAWEPEKLEKQIELQRRTNADLLFTGSAFMDSEGHPIDWYLHAPKEVTYRQLLKQNVLSNSSALVRKEL